MEAYIGVDISKAKLDVTLLVEKKKRRKRVNNSESGIDQLQKWLKKQGVSEGHICMESTSVYWELVAEKMSDAAYKVSVVNPVRIKGYAMSQLRRSKTDPVDGDVIADFCRTQQPQLWTPPTPKQRKLRALVRHLEALKKSRRRQQNRLSTCRDADVAESLKAILTLLEAQIEAVEQQIRQLVDDDPDLKERKELLESIKGFGEKTAIHILAEMYDLHIYDNAKAAAADAGVTPSHYQSGSSVRRRSKMSRMGKGAIRAALHFPAMTAIRFNPLVRQLAQRLQHRGKSANVIRVAAMRKLMHIAFGVLKHKRPFDPAYTA